MKIKDKEILAQFGMSGSSYTPAEIAKKYDLNKFHKILADPDSSKMQRDTAEMMIANMNLKIAKLGLIQESKKGFPQGIPQIAMPYIESMGIQPDQFLNTQAQPEQPAGDMAQWGGIPNLGSRSFEEFKHKALYPSEKYVSKRPAPVDKLTHKDLDASERRILGFIKDFRSRGEQIPEGVAETYNQIQEARKTLGKAPEAGPYKGETAYYNAEGKKVRGLSGQEQWKSYAGEKDPSKSYWERVKGANVLRRDPSNNWFSKETDVVDPRMGEALEKILPFYGKGPKDAGDYIKTLFTAPQFEMNNLLTGYYESPYTTYLRYNKEPENWAARAALKYGTDPMIIDTPYNLLAKGVTKVAPHAAKAAGVVGEFAAKYGTKAAEFVAEQAMKLYGKITPKILENILKTSQKFTQASMHDDDTSPEMFKSPITTTPSGSNRPSPFDAIWSPEQMSMPASISSGFNPATPMPTQIPANMKVEKPTIQDTVISKADLKAGKLTPAQIKDLMARRDAGKLNVSYKEDGGQYEYQWGGGYLPQAQDGGDPLAEAYNKLTKKSTGKPSTNTRVTGIEPEDLDVKGRYIGRETERTPGGYNPRSPYKNDQDLIDAYKKMGIDYSALTDREAQRALYKKADPFQVAYMWGEIGNTARGLKSKQDPKFNQWKPLDKESIEDYEARLTKAGITPESLRKDLSPYEDSFADSYRGLREASLLNPKQKKALPQIKQEQPVVGPIKPGPGIQYAPQQDYAPWWLQDVIGTAHAAGNMARVRKYAPWQATPEYQLPDPTFYDPTRELAANAEMANIGTQGLAAFTGPQSFNAGFSQIQGQGAKNAADIMGRYNNLNVGVANDFEMKRKEIANNASAQRAGLATGLADKYTIMNQQFDNSKGIRRDQLVDKYVNAITNKQYTANLNDLTDQYKIDPSSGGRIRWTHGRPISPETQKDHWEEVVGAVKTLMEKGMDKENAVKIVSDYFGKGKGTADNSIYSEAAMRGYRG